jgi:short-subunit dehydrogenase
MIAINLTGVFNGVSAFAADMRARRGGHIVNTASMAGLANTHPGIGDYVTAKFGVVALSECLRIELEPHGVGVSVLCPGLVKTNLPVNTARLRGDLPGSAGGIPDSAMSAALVADKVIDGIERNLPYIITHPERWPAVAARMNALREAFLTP